MKFLWRKRGRTIGHYGVIATLFAALSMGVAQAGELKIVHINDHHSHLKPDGRMSLNLGGKSTMVDLPPKFRLIRPSGFRCEW